MWMQSFSLLVLTCFLESLTRTPARIVPSLRTDALLCYFCPLLNQSKPCRNFTTQCLPDEVCAISRGYDDTRHVLSSQGCIKRDLCASHEVKTHLGHRYKVTHTCCCRNKCNARSKQLLGMIRGTKNDVEVVKEQPFDTCADYVSPLAAESAKA